MAVTTSIYHRDLSGIVERVTVMAALADDEEPDSEIRVIHERDGATVSDGIAYFGPEGHHWMADHRAARLAEGYVQA